MRSFTAIALLAVAAAGADWRRAAGDEDGAVQKELAKVAGT